MRWRDLLGKSRTQLAHSATPAAGGYSFRAGARWMAGQLSVLRQLPPDSHWHEGQAYNRYGCLKYGLSTAGFGLVAGALPCWIGLPLAVLAFYVLEVHFLFLFPLLIDGVPQPMQASIRMTYRLGLRRAVANTLPIGLYMLAGLGNRPDPLRRWHEGCLAVLIWYEEERAIHFT